ncbi:MAG: site-specific DNA-methyltransferase [Candidatus Anammoximicrobium sp.]|nr:site-specific DNA-methyltransferase [Candidatus Anammoximicrobium sp.]
MTAIPVEASASQAQALAAIRRADDGLRDRFADRLAVNHDLDRSLVSFQANKAEQRHRWCKYKEGFSAELVRYVLKKTGLASSPILDPFAGSGTALFTAREAGLDAVGIELLDSSAEIIEVRNAVAGADQRQLAGALAAFRDRRSWCQAGKQLPFPHLRITAGAFPKETEQRLGRYLWETGRVEDPVLSRVLRFAALCVLEPISYTRKDGQYLRWDQRSGRGLGKKAFDKGRIETFDEAIAAKLSEIASDLDEKQRGCLRRLRDQPERAGRIELLRGSCLEILPTLPANHFSGLITSPPYCNRYDYTRTYALELAMLGVGEEAIRKLRQTMLSCTVENREKQGLDQHFDRRRYAAATRAVESQGVLSLILKYLDGCRRDKTINHAGIPRMVRNYFAEMALVIFESARALKPGAPLVMVNDNVRYQGAHVPVDLILSDFAEQAGFEVEAIWVLPRGKGNSSQQMGLHGREEIRKCVYVWRKANVR